MSSNICINTIKEIRVVILKIRQSEEIETTIKGFIKAFGLDKIDGFQSLFMFYLKQELEDADVSELSDEEFKHVGGPIILNSLGE